jgi:hypothetical protein
MKSVLFLFLTLTAQISSAEIEADKKLCYAEEGVATGFQGKLLTSRCRNLSELTPERLQTVKSRLEKKPNWSKCQEHFANINAALRNTKVQKLLSEFSPYIKLNLNVSENVKKTSVVRPIAAYESHDTVKKDLLSRPGARLILADREKDIEYVKYSADSCSTTFEISIRKLRDSQGGKTKEFHAGWADSDFESPDKFANQIHQTLLEVQYRETEEYQQELQAKTAAKRELSLR